MVHSVKIRAVKRLVFMCAAAWLRVASGVDVEIDFRPERNGAGNPGDVVNRINVTVGSVSFPIVPPEVEWPFASNFNGTDTPGVGERWGGEGLLIGDAYVEFMIDQIVDYAGNAGSGSFRLDAIGLGMGIDSASPEEAWFLLDGRESFSWTASRTLKWRGLSLRSFGSNGTRGLRVGSTNWIGLAGVEPASGVAFDPSEGVFTISNTFGNAAEDGLTAFELVGADGPELYFSSMSVSNVGEVGDVYSLNRAEADALSVEAPGILGNDETQGSLSTFAIVEREPRYGALALNANGAFAYTPNEGFTGWDDFTYKTANAAVTGGTARVDLFIDDSSRVFESAPLPFRETFDELRDGPLAGRNEWRVVGDSAEVRAREGDEGRALELALTEVTRSISNTRSMVWSSFRARYETHPALNPESPDPNAVAAFLVNTNGNLVVYGDEGAMVLDVRVPVGVWNVFDVCCDFETRTWNLSMNGTNVIAGVPFHAERARLSALRVEHSAESAVCSVDEVVVVDEEPVNAVADWDGDRLPDWWERKYFGSISNAEPSAENINAYIAGLEPGEVFEIRGFPLDWERRPGRRYALYESTNLMSEFALVQSNLSWSGVESFGGVDERSNVFYRVEVELDP